MTEIPSPQSAGEPDTFVDLRRTFHRLSTAGPDSDDMDIVRGFRSGEHIDWADLVKNYRVVILSEAGAGKTREIRNATEAMRREGKAAFFMRLENLVGGVEDAFEEKTGTFEQFSAWLDSVEEGWLLLDSVDEARLRDPGDFKRAVRVLSKAIRAAKDRTHIILTGRASAWRAKTDLDLCVEAFPPPRQASQKHLDGSEGGQVEILRKPTRGADEQPSFLVVSLDDLDADQVRLFARAKGVTDAEAFMTAIEKADASPYTARPEDLAELTQFWLDSGRIGGRLEMLRNSIGRRLRERDQERADHRPIAFARLQDGAMLVAAAATLARQQTIRVPDGSATSEGLDLRQVLDDWDDRDQLTLLSRPIFDEAIYSTVRFHHRSVREYLTAEWFAKLLANQTSRRSIENLFFREQYGLEIVVPALRPVLPWLILLDDKILDRVRRVAPEVIFEGGDPARLPLEVRRYVLAEICEQIAAGGSRRSAEDYAAVQRFANVDLAGDIEALLSQYAGNPDLQSLLLKMVWLGEISSLSGVAMHIARDAEAEHYARIMAFRALAAVGTAEDVAEVRDGFAAESAELDRGWFSELLEGAPVDCRTAQWILQCLPRLKALERYAFDHVQTNLLAFIAVAEVTLLPEIVRLLEELLRAPPVIERRHCEISERNQWLIVPAAKAVSRLIAARVNSALDEPALAVLRAVSAAEGYGVDNLGTTKAELRPLVRAWPELNNALFWSEIEGARAFIDHKSGERLTEFWQASIWSSLAEFRADSFDYALGQIEQQSFLDNKLVALSLAFVIYRDAGRPQNWREKLWRRARKHSELSDRLRHYLNPPPPSKSAKGFRRTEARWKRQDAKRKADQEAYHAGWKEYLASDLDKIAALQQAEPGRLTNPVYYLFGQSRDDRKITSRWTEYNWKDLAEEYGEKSARFYRDSAVAFWRLHDPRLRSEGYPANTTAHDTIIGLAGLEIEAIEASNSFPVALSHDEVLKACKHASFELNGFPLWFPTLFAAFPETVGDFLMQEIGYELSKTDAAGEMPYILSDVSWSGQWAWDRLAPDILRLLRGLEPSTPDRLRKLLKILHGSSAEGADIAELAMEKCASPLPVESLALWYAAWTGIDPQTAIPALIAHVGGTDDASKRSEIVMRFVTALWGGRGREGVGARSAFRQPEHLKELYLMVHDHVRTAEDIERAGKGVYSPGLRDHAQEARSALLDMLTQIPGKDAFLALLDISKYHPVESLRPWMLHHAKTKAEQDGDLEPWSIPQIRDFARVFERTPANHRDLAELVHLRLLDLKDDYENGDASVASLLLNAGGETEVRKFLGNVLREQARGRYSVPQEEEMADAKRPDLRFVAGHFDGPVPVELKLADKWTGPDLFERLRNQLCGDYLRDKRSSRGFFLLVWTGSKMAWDHPDTGERLGFDELVVALNAHWRAISGGYPKVDDVVVIGIDLTARSKRPAPPVKPI